MALEKVVIRKQDMSVQMICKKDPLMKKLVNAIGDIEIQLRTDYFASIVRSIVGQQISVPAASAIYGRLLDLLDGQITAEGLLGKPTEALREVGLTKRKTEYVQDLAEKVITGKLDIEHIADYDNDAIMEQLIAVKGIGKWTAEMFLILSLGRDDVLAVDDVGIQRAAKWLYGVETSERRQVLVDQSPLWKPHRSIASFYLWGAIHLGYVADYESVDALGER